MVTSDGKCRIDGIQIGEIALNLLGPSPSMTAKYALCGASTGSRFGAGTRYSWGEATLSKLRELVEMMEMEISADVFEGGSTTTGGVTDSTPQVDDVPSL